MNEYIVISYSKLAYILINILYIVFIYPGDNIFIISYFLLDIYYLILLNKLSIIYVLNKF